MNPKIVEYQLAGSESYETFVEIVNDYIRKGYQPYGNPFVATEGDKTFYNQIVVKYED